jgi:hypothetical protein
MTRVIMLVDENMQKKNHQDQGSLVMKTTLMFSFTMGSRNIIYYFESYTKKML